MGRRGGCPDTQSAASPCPPPKPRLTPQRPPSPPPPPHPTHMLARTAPPTSRAAPAPRQSRWASSAWQRTSRLLWSCSARWSPPPRSPPPSCSSCSARRDDGGGRRRRPAPRACLLPAPYLFRPSASTRALPLAPSVCLLSSSSFVLCLNKRPAALPSAPRPPCLRTHPPTRAPLPSPVAQPKQVVNSLEHRNDNPASIPPRELAKLIYGRDSVFARDPTPEQARFVLPSFFPSFMCSA